MKSVRRVVLPLFGYQYFRRDLTIEISRLPATNTDDHCWISCSLI
jgi:hypothetical protein